MSEKIKAIRGSKERTKDVKQWLRAQGALMNIHTCEEPDFLYFVRDNKSVDFLPESDAFLFDVEELPRWRAPQGKQYYYITSLYLINKIPDHYQNFNDRHYEVGNYFATLEEAEEMRNNLLFQLTSKRI